MNNKYFVCIIFLLAFFIEKSNAQYLQFVENKGQWDKSIKFKSHIGCGDVSLQAGGYKVTLHNKDDIKRIADYFGAHHDSTERSNAASITNFKKAVPNLTLHSHAYQVSFVGADTNAAVEPDKALNTYNNYFIGKDSSKWKSGCRVYNGVTYKNIYKNVDVRFFSDNGNLNYDLIVNPGADVSKIALKIDGLDNLSVNKYGNLTFKTSVGDIYQSIPSTYQISKSLKTKVKAGFILKDNIVHFKLGDYDKNATLIIDPTEIFSSFVGVLSDDWGYTATYDNAGNFYAAGIALFGDGFLHGGVGGYDETFNGGDGKEGSGIACDITIIKFNPTGTQALYTTYLGGAGDEQPHSLIVDNDNNLVVAGRTSSIDFPTTTSTFGPGGSFDIILSKLSADGKSLLASRKFGGSSDDGVNIAPKYANLSSGNNQSIRRNYGDDAHSEVIVDNKNNIYLASCTQSADFPTTSNAFRKSLGGFQDGVFIKASSDLNTIDNCTLLGGDGDDAAFVLNISRATGNIYIAGGTTSTNIAFNASEVQGILHTSYQGGECDGFISELSSDGNTLLKTSYVGTPGNDIVYGVETDKYGFPFIMGTTTQTFPVINSPFNANGNQDKGKQFITKLNPELSQVIYNANFGKGLSTPDISPTAFLVDICGNVYVSGWGGSANFEYNKANTLVGMPTTANALLRTTDGNDFYFFVLEKDALSQLFGSFFGTEGDPEAYGDHVDGGTSRFDRRGVIYQAICANCGKRGTFPTTTGAWSPGNPSQEQAFCNEAAVKIAFELSGVIASIRPSINGVAGDSTGCVPLTVDFTDTIALGKKYIWTFGDGSSNVTTTAPTTSHTYLNVGDYQARVISIDSSLCNIADTAYVIIKARNNRAVLNYTISKLPPCESLNYQFTNTSIAPTGFPFGANDFTWDFGDGTKIITNAPTVQHQYASSGTYFVKLYLNDTNYCNSPDSLVTQLRVASTLVAQFITPPLGCTPYNAVFNNTSLGGQQFVWDFGDGTTSTDPSPTHLYSNPGTYTIHLSATDNLTCNPTDDTSITITVIEGPLASFNFSPTEPKENTPYQFTNLSTNAVRYKWDFGDGDTLITTDLLTPVSHLFNTSNTFKVCLIAYNANGCTDTSCQMITAVVVPLADVPNAFSPNGDGTNDVVSVKGYGISKMSWTIYNRWGKLVFSSSSISNGWDGRYQGVLQPQDVYAYVLNITFSDNTVFHKKGDITLLR